MERIRKLRIIRSRMQYSKSFKVPKDSKQNARVGFHESCLKREHTLLNYSVQKLDITLKH